MAPGKGSRHKHAGHQRGAENEKALAGSKQEAAEAEEWILGRTGVDRFVAREQGAAPAQMVVQGGHGQQWRQRHRAIAEEPAQGRPVPPERHHHEDAARSEGQREDQLRVDQRACPGAQRERPTWARAIPQAGQLARKTGEAQGVQRLRHGHPGVHEEHRAAAKHQRGQEGCGRADAQTPRQPEEQQARQRRDEGIGDVTGDDQEHGGGSGLDLRGQIPDRHARHAHQRGEEAIDRVDAAVRSLVAHGRPLGPDIDTMAGDDLFGDLVHDARVDPRPLAAGHQRIEAEERDQQGHFGGRHLRQEFRVQAGCRIVPL